MEESGQRGAPAREGRLCGQKRIGVTKKGVTKRCRCGASIKKGVAKLQVGVASGGGAVPKKGVTKVSGCGQRCRWVELIMLYHC